MSGTRYYRVERWGADEVLVRRRNPWLAIDAAVARWFGARAVWRAINAHSSVIDERGRFCERGCIRFTEARGAERCIEAQVIVTQVAGWMPEYNGINDLRVAYAAQARARAARAEGSR